MVTALIIITIYFALVYTTFRLAVWSWGWFLKRLDIRYPTVATHDFPRSDLAMCAVVSFIIFAVWPVLFFEGLSARREVRGHVDYEPELTAKDLKKARRETQHTLTRIGKLETNGAGRKGR